MKIKKKNVIALCKYLALKTCIQDISKTITASSFKLSQLIAVDNLVFFFFNFASVIALCTCLALKTCSQDISKTIQQVALT